MKVSYHPVAGCVRGAIRVMSAAMVIAVSVGTAMMTMPAASAAVDVATGMPIRIGDHRCSLGFFGFDARGDRLAVTAGHCSDGQLNQPVYKDGGTKIGEVVAWKSDVSDGSGKLTGARGYTVFTVYRNLSLEPFFTGIDSSIDEGSAVTKFGERTAKTSGVITSVQYDAERPDLALLSSDMVQLPGDSGCPWYTEGPMLIGIGSSGDQENGGGTAGSQAQPIRAVVEMIRANGGVWGDDFKVWTQ
jgi:hypothetical protein